MAAYETTRGEISSRKMPGMVSARTTQRGEGEPQSRPVKIRDPARAKKPLATRPSSENWKNRSIEVATDVTIPV